MVRARTTTATTRDPVEQAMAAVQRGVDQLVKLLGSEDMEVIARAERCLGEIGPFAAWSLMRAGASAHAPVPDRAPGRHAHQRQACPTRP